MWWLTSIEESLKRIADALERIVIKDGPYKDHIMTVSRNSVVEDYLYDNPTREQSQAVTQDIQVLVDLPEMLHPEWATSYEWEVITTMNDGSLPKRIEYRHKEEAALLLFNQRKNIKNAHVELNKTCKFRVAQQFN